MKIGINLSFARKPDSGMGQVSLNFIRTLIDRVFDDSDLKKHEFVLYLEEDLDLGLLPDNFQKRVFLPFFYKRDDLIRKVYFEKYWLISMARKDKVDLFFSLYQSATVFPKSFGMKHLILLHDSIPKIFPQYLNNSRKKFYYHLVDQAVQAADGLMTVSNFSKKEAIRVYGLEGEKITVAHIDCDEIFKEKLLKGQKEDVLRRYSLKDGEYIFYVGGFDYRKNMEGLVDAYGRFLNKIQEFNLDLEAPDLVLAGSFHQHLVPLQSDLPKLIEEASKRYSFGKEKIKMIGFVETDVLPMLYSGARFFVYPSFYEGFGLPVLEAMNMDCAVLTSSNSSIVEIVDESCGLLVDSENSDEIADGMKKLMEKDFAKKLTGKAKKRSEDFSWNKFLDKFLEVINKYEA